MGSRFNPPFPGRNVMYTGPGASTGMLERDIDMITRQIGGVDRTTLFVQDRFVRTPKFPILNDSSNDVFSGLWYGRDYTATTTGVIALAGGDVRPIALSASFASPGEEFDGVIGGSGIMILDPTTVTEPLTTPKGAAVFLSGTAGYGRPSLGATGKQWYIGMLDEDSFNINDMQIAVSVQIPLQPSGGL